MLKVGIIGLGSHSEVVYSILSETHDNIIFLSYGHGGKVVIPSTYHYQHLYMGDVVDYISSHKDENIEYIVAVGDNKLRKNIVMALPKNLKYVNAVSKQSFISPNVELGVGNVICPGAIIQTSCKIKDHCILNTNCSIDHHTTIHSYVHVAPNCAICGNVTLYEGAFIGVGVSITPNIKVRAWFFYKANTLVKCTNSPIPIYVPYLKNSFKSAISAIESTWVSSQGEFLKMSTKRLKDMLNVKHVLLVNNGTSATHCLLLALKYKYPHVNRIYCPNSVYVAVYNTVLYEYDISSISILKIDSNTWNVKHNREYWDTLETGSAVIVVHNLGNIMDVPLLKKWRPDLIFLEDNCEGLFGKYGNLYSGTCADTLCSSVSFFGNKTITSGEGGAVLTNDDDVYAYLSKVCNQGNSTIRYLHDVMGYNYRMTNIQAAILYDQLDDLDFILVNKGRVFDFYRKNINVKYQQILENNSVHSNWIFGVRIKGVSGYEEVERHFSEHGIETRPFFYPVNSHKHLNSIEYNDHTPAILKKECFMLPSYPELKLNELDYIVDVFNKLAEKYDSY